MTCLPDSDLDDLYRRLAATRRSMLPQGVEQKRGTDADFLAQLLAYWRNRYDWRTHEARILGLPWEAMGSGGRVLRAVHQRASAFKAPAALLRHGWPDSVLRFQRLLALLGDVNVVIPALPSFPFSYELTQPGMTALTMALLVADAMRALGYDRYVISAGDTSGQTLLNSLRRRTETGFPHCT